MKLNLVFFLLLLAFKCGFSQGELWGTAYQGGADGLGVIFSTDFEGKGFALKKEFKTQYPGASPFYAQLCEATLTTRKLYGIVAAGGTTGGMLFEYDPVIQSYARKVNIDGVPKGSLVQATNGKLYGMTNDRGNFGFGVLFEFDPVSNTYSKKIDFDGTNKGKNPSGSLTVGSNGKLYGMTYEGGINNNGVIFAFDPSDASYTKLWDFDGVNGARPFGDIVETTNGIFYGMTYAGGVNYAGVIFEFNSNNGVFTKGFDLDISTGGYPYGNLTLAPNGKLYGMTSLGGVNGYDSKGVLFQFDVSNFTYSVMFEFNETNGSKPFGSLLSYGDGKLYGTTSEGGLFGAGTIFEYTPGTNQNLKLFDFEPSDAQNPFGTLTRAMNGKTYGLAANGGKGFGAIFEYDLSNSKYSKLVDFSATVDGALPLRSLTQASNGKIYGYTSVGGEFGFGVIFEFDVFANQFKARANIDQSLREPFGKLIQFSGDILYGVSANGGANKKGAIFQFQISTGLLSKVFDFDGDTGRGPMGMTLVESKLLGVCSNGGSNDLGTIFEFNPSSKSVIKKLDFNITNGGVPLAELLQASNGKIYGLANANNTSNGNLFEYDPNLNTYKKLIDFLPEMGYTFLTSLIEPSNGRIFGVATNGGSNNGRGTLFEYNISTGIFEKKADFNGVNGAGPQGALSVSSNGRLYGVTALGGTNDMGVIFELDVNSGGFVKKLDFNGANGANPVNVQLLFVPSRQNQNIVFSPIPTKRFGDPSFTLVASTNSGLPITFQSSNSSVAKVEGNVVTILSAGSTNITASQPGGVNYNPASDVTQALVVEKANQSVSFGSLQSKTFGDVPFAVAATASSGLPVVFTSSNPQVASVSGSMVTIKGAGSTNIVATQNGDANFNSASVTQSLTVNKLDQTITFSAIPTKTLAEAPFNLLANSTTSLAISFRTTTPTKVSVSGAQVTLLTAGKATIVASQLGNESVNPAQEVSQTFCVNPIQPVVTASNVNSDSPQLISSNSIGNQWFKDGVAIQGATGATFSATRSGTYSVESTVDGCKSSRSNDFPLVVTQDSALTFDNVEIYPNPAHETIMIRFPTVSDEKEIVFYDLLGREAKSITTRSETVEVDVRQFSTGYFIIQVNTKSQSYKTKFYRK